MTQTNENPTTTGLEIAVVGMAGRFPGARNIEAFWDNLKQGVESIAFFSDEELEEEGTSRDLMESPNYVRARGVLEDAAVFDASFFDYISEEAKTMDPQMRIFHECSWEALEDAGYDPGTYPGLIGIYAGITPNYQWAVGNFLRKNTGSEQLMTAYLNSNFFSSLISYKLNLKGPAITVQTACSTSLAAIHQACRALLTGECHMALGGGVTVTFPEKSGYLYEPGMIHSADGHCRAFDAQTTGVIAGSGAGIVVLKRLDASIADGDRIYAVIKGSAVNNDGNRKVGYTAPSVEGQVEVIKAAQLMAEVPPESIGYIETHGTGTTFGDPIEIESLKRAFGSQKSGGKKYCAIGSVKTNVGHLDSAAGVAGFIKTVMALKHKLIPPSLHYETPNPKIDIENTPFYGNNELREWQGNGYPLRAGVSSFGIGGTNVHVILEEAPPRGGSSVSRDYQIIMLSAKTGTALDRVTANFVEFLESNREIILADAAYTLQVGRQPFEHRRMSVCADVTETIKNFSSPGSANLHSFVAAEEKKPVIFMFPGQGSQYVNMGLELYQKEPLFREEMDRCFQVLRTLMGDDIKEILYPADSVSKVSGNEDPAASPGKINRTEIAQPMIFSIEYALAKLLMKWGISPYAMIGHSIGEYTAAHLSGVFLLEDALRMVVLRGKLMAQMPGGAMLSVALTEEELLPLLNRDISLAAVNAPSLCTVSGSHEAISAFEKQLKEKGHNSTRLHTSHAFHSAMMDPILKEFKEKLGEVSFNEPRIPYISNLTGNWITVQESADPGYWADHLRKTVRFGDGLKEVVKEGDGIFLEVGPGTVLSTLVRKGIDQTSGHLTLSLMRHPQEDIPDLYCLLNKVGQLWLYGEDIDWSAFYAGEKRQRVSLPTYPFEGRYYWLAYNPFKIPLQEKETLKAPPRKRSNTSDWFYTPLWEKSILTTKQSTEISQSWNWLIFIDEYGLGTKLVKELEPAAREIIVVRSGSRFTQKSEREYVLDPQQEEHYNTLISRLIQLEKTPHKILHLWSVGEISPDIPWLEGSKRVRELGYYSLLAIARAIGEQEIKGKIQIEVVSDNLQEVIGEEDLCPLKAAVLGAVKVIPLEYANIECRSIDVVRPPLGSQQETRLVNHLLAEFTIDSPDKIIAYRGSHRWTQTIKAVRFEKDEAVPQRLREKGVYLITGGLGGIGFTLAEYLAKTLQARLVLTGRSSFPPRENWDQWLKENLDKGKDSISISEKIIKMKQWEALGAEIMILCADVGNHQQMQEIVALAEEKFGGINGVIHSAGLPDGALVRRRTREISETIFQSKVQGTLVLDDVLKDTELDFFVLCSSLNSILASIGQAGYCAANIFLDAFAYYKAYQNGTFTLSINWDAWQEVGMAAAALQQTMGTGEAVHPLFRWSEAENPDKIVYNSLFSVDRYWVLNEHRIMGKPTLPGTAYIEMARAAFEEHSGSTRLEIHDLYFLKPLVIEENAEREVRTILKKNGQSFHLTIASRLNPKGNRWEEHARGKLRPMEKEAVVKYKIEEIKNRCTPEEIPPPGKAGETHPVILTTGPRWNHSRETLYNGDEGLMRLELPHEFADDLQAYKLHPALMDSATAFLTSRSEGKEDGIYVPFSFKRLKLKGALQESLYSYARYVENNDPEKNTLKFNITILDEKGIPLVEIEEFTVLRISEEKITNSTKSDNGINSEVIEPLPGNPLQNGIIPAEGVDIFTRVLAGNLPQVVVSTRDLTVLTRYNIPQENGIEGDKPPKEVHQRPDLSTPYVAPGNETEQILVDILKESLGLESVGIKDNFFELGGDSLKAITLSTKIHKMLNVKIEVAEFFSRPRVEMLAQYITENSSKSIYSSIKPTEKKEYYSLPSPQKRLYFQQQMQPDNVSYNLPQAILLEGELDKNLFNNAFQALIQRHESVLTSFRLTGEGPVQKVHSKVDFKVEYKEANENEVEAIIDKFVRPFDLHRVPMLRVEIFQVGENRYVCLFDIHHIIADATGCAILQKDLLRLYNGEVLPAMRIQYKDFSTWQNDLIKSGVIKKQEEYWLNVYAGGIPRLNFPTDYPVPEAFTFAGTNYTFRLDSHDTLKFKSLGSSLEATLFMNLLAVLNVLLFKYTGQPDIVVGCSIAGRPHADLQEIVGMFVNMLAIKNFPDQQISYVEFLEKVKTTTFEAFANQDMQFDVLVEKLNQAEDSSRNTLLEVCLNMENYEQPAFEIKGLNVSPYGVKAKASKFAILLWANDMGDGIRFLLEYSTELFKHSTIKTFAERYIQVVKQVIENKDIKLKDIKVAHDFLASEKTIPRMDFDF